MSNFLSVLFSGIRVILDSLEYIQVICSPLFWEVYGRLVFILL